MMLGRRWPATVLSAGVLAGLLALAACSGDSGVASLDANGGAGASLSRAEEIAAQAQGAKDMVECLAAVEIPASASDAYGDGQLDVQLDLEDASMVGWGPGGGGPAGLSGAEPAWMLEAAGEYDPYLAAWVEAGPDGPPAPVDESVEPPPYLITMDGDRTRDFVACLGSSGYHSPTNYPPDPDEEVAAKEEYLEPTIKWIECARRNGYPDLKDPLPVKADEFATEPTAVLPADITEQALRDVLANCPAFDEAAWLAHEQAMAEIGRDATLDQVEEVFAKHPLGDPNIGFDVPGADGDHRPGRPTDAPYPDSVIRGYEILREARDQFYEKYPELLRTG